LWVVDPSLAVAEDEGVREVVGDWPGAVRVFRPALRPGDGPVPGTGWDADAVVLLGSRASVHDRLDWLDGLAAWLGPLVDGSVRVPVLGVCFGHQLLAHLSGGPVDYVAPDRRKLVEIGTSRLEGGTLLPGRHELRVVVSHCEEVKQPPHGFRVVASRGAVAVDGLEHEDLPLYSFQFHPEARDAFAGRAGLASGAVDARVREDGRRVLEAFRHRVAARIGR